MLSLSDSAQSKRRLLRFVAEWIESWDPEAMTSHTGRSGFTAWLAQVGQSFCTQGSRFFSIAESVVAKQVGNYSRF